MSQKIIVNEKPVEAINKITKKHEIKRFMLVCDSSFELLSTYEEYKTLDNIAVRFDGFSPNPLYKEVLSGVEIFKAEKCDAIIAIGGGSTIDTAKCIKAFSKMPDGELYFLQKFPKNDLPLIAVPTTAGTGSESTKYAVIYYNGVKQSVTDDSLIPDYALLDARNLATLPTYQKKCTLLDAFCQGIESWWSVNATEESKKYSSEAVSLIVNNISAYLNGDEKCVEMMTASNLAGRAINITQTTAAHAMSYKLTSLYKIPHGRAVFVCLPFIWEYMIKQAESNKELSKTFNDIACALKCSSPKAAVTYLKELNRELFGEMSVDTDDDDIEFLVRSVNATRLKNNPVMLSENTITDIYSNVLEVLSFSTANEKKRSINLNLSDKICV